MKTKQGIWIVECVNREQTINVISYTKNYKEKTDWQHWRYVYYNYENREDNVFNIFKNAKSEHPNAELISFSDWEKLPNDEIDILGESKSYKEQKEQCMPHINIGTISRLKNEKELIGWKLEKDEYREAAGLIAYLGYGDNRFSYYESGCNFRKDSTAEERLKKAGVLELWFSPVYKEEEKTIKLSFGELTQEDIEQLKQALK